MHLNLLSSVKRLMAHPVFWPAVWWERCLICWKIDIGKWYRITVPSLYVGLNDLDETNLSGRCCSGVNGSKKEERTWNFLLLRQNKLILSAIFSVFFKRRRTFWSSGASELRLCLIALLQAVCCGLKTEISVLGYAQWKQNFSKFELVTVAGEDVKYKAVKGGKVVVPACIE
jgi:hypothetical protein